MNDEMKKDLENYRRYQIQLINTTNQKNYYKAREKAIKETLATLEKTESKEVYKNLGSLLVPTNKEDVEKELKKELESVEIKIKSLEKQEKILIEKLNGIREKIEVKHEKPKTGS